ncbi:hypothetical protein AHF37_07104 [Paragonimus kellicotti]|nr:hypothetical protein AHF37_07104 [Paragonimus kellicotti]
MSSKGGSPPAITLPTRLKPGPLVVILPQVESVPSSVLEEFIELTSLYVSGQIGGRPLPIFLVLGLSTTPEVGFEARLSASTLGRLKLERFTVPAPAVFLEAVLNTLIHFPGFHLTHSICAYLMDSLFLCLDYSVRNFIRRVQFCMLEHYLNCAHPHLLLTPEKARVYLSSLPSQSLANMVSLTYPSVAAFAIESGQPRPSLTAKPIRGKSPSLVDRLTDQLVVHWRVQYLVPPVLKWLLHLTSHVSPLPLGKSLSIVYSVNQAKGSDEVDSVTEVDKICGLSKEKLLQALDEAASYLDSSSCRAFQHLWPKDVLSVCHEMLTELAAATRQWHDALHTAATETSTTIRKYPACQDGSDPSSTNASPAVQAFTANPFDGRRKMSMRGLRQLPDLQLDASDCLIPTLPDLCILYKLHLESTKIINLYDWLMAFASVVGENVGKHNPPSKHIQCK